MYYNKIILQWHHALTVYPAYPLQWEREGERSTLWPLSRAENLLWQLSLMFVQAFCYQPGWALRRHQGCQGFQFYRWGNMRSDIYSCVSSEREMIPVILSPHESRFTPCLIFSFVPSQLLRIITLQECTVKLWYAAWYHCPSHESALWRAERASLRVGEGQLQEKG